MKSRLRVFRTVLAVLSAAALCASCAGGSGRPVIPADYVPLSDENPFLVDTGYRKPEIKLDGVLDDAAWDGLPELTFGATNKAAVKAFYGQTGVYFGVKVFDTDVWASSKTVTDNSSFELYIDPTGAGGKKPAAQQYQINIDARENNVVRRGNGTAWERSSIIKSYAVKVDGTLNDKQPDAGYTVELFIPYTQLGGQPAADYGLGFGLVNSAGGLRRAWSGIPGVNVHSPETYFKFYRDTNSIEEPRKVNRSELTMDGRNDERAWKNRLIYAFGTGGAVRVRAYFGNNGLYFFFDVKDKQVKAEGTACYLNDSVEIYLDVQRNKGASAQTDDVQIRADAAGHVELLRGTGKTPGPWVTARNNAFTGVQILDGVLNGPSASGFRIEVFVPWSDLGLDKAPGAMNVNFGVVNWNGELKEDGSHKTSWSGTGQGPQIPDEYIELTKNGVKGAVAPPAEPEIKLDGDLSDAQWAGMPAFKYYQDRVTVNWFWTEKACYVGFTVTDPNVMTDGARTYNNSSVEIYIDYDNYGGPPNEPDRAVFVDAAGNFVFRKGDDATQKYKDYGSIGIRAGVKKTASGYVVELCIPWSEFGGTKPQRMGVAFGCVTRPTADAKTAWHNDGLCTNPQNPALYSLWTASGVTKKTGY